MCLVWFFATAGLLVACLSAGDSVCLLRPYRIAVTDPAPAPWGLCVCWGQAKPACVGDGAGCWR